MYDLPVGKGRKFLNTGGGLNPVLGGWNVLVTLSPQSGHRHVQLRGQSLQVPVGRPVAAQPAPADDQVKSTTGAWESTASRRTRRTRLYNISSFAYPAQFTYGSLGSGTQRGLWLIWPQWSLSKYWTLERYKFSVRVDGNNIPVRLSSQTPNTTVNLSSPETFGKFGLQTSSSYSTMGQSNGQSSSAAASSSEVVAVFSGPGMAHSHPGRVEFNH